MLLLPKVGLRREAQQERSRQMVGAILSAAHELFITQPFDDVSMSAIADRAGVSFGSLYQYFESKEALLVELTRRRMAEHVTRFEQCLQSLRGRSREEIVRGLAREVASFLGEDYPLRRVLVRHLPRPAGSSDESILSRYKGAIAELLGGGSDFAVGSLLHSVEGVIDAAANAEQNLFADPSYVQRFEDWAVALVTASASSPFPG